MEDTARAVRFPRSSQRLVRLRSGNRFTNDLLAWVTRLVRSVRNSTFLPNSGATTPLPER